ncbi:MAG TPA: hypothetical protein VGM53_05065 [Streptosporangiaceae bacterium]|jgi:hypothetical protein
MNASSSPDEGLTAEQAAAGGADPIPDLPGPQARAHPGAQPAYPARLPQRPSGGARPARADGPARGGGENESGPAETAVAGAGHGSGLKADTTPPSRLLESDELQRAVARWKEIQAHFVDEPRTAVEQADALVAGLMQQVTAMLSRERAELEERWAGGSEVSTEELRQSLRRYRAFFERLLAA